MNADRVEASWDKEKKSWLIRIEVGSEVIRRHYEAPQTADDQALRTAVEKTAADEGYDVAAANITLRR
jgi:hypothetical protein